MVAAESLAGHYLRWGGPQRKDVLHGAVIFPVGAELLSRAAVGPVRQNGGSPAAESADGAGAAAAAHRHGGNGKPQRRDADRDLWRAYEPLSHFRRPGRVQRGADSGYHAGGRSAGRGGADAPLLCGAGCRPVQCAGKQAVVQLQPGGTGALVL